MKLAVTFASVLAAAATLASCAGQSVVTGNWTRPGATPAMLETDKAKCHYEAEVATAPIENAVEAGMKEGFMEVACMKAKGWVRGG